MLTPLQAAQHLGLSARKVYDLAASGRLACYRFDSAVRFEPSDLDAYKQSSRSPATTRAAGSTNLTAASPVPGDNALTAYFRRAGHARKLTNTTTPRPRASTRLRVVSPSTNP